MKSNITVLKQNGTRNVSSQHSAVLVDRASLPASARGGWRAPRKQGPMSTCSKPYGLTETGASTGPQHLHYIFQFLWNSWVCKEMGSWFLCLLLGFFFSVLSVCFIQFQCVDLCFILFYFIISLFSFFPKKSVFLWETEMEWLWMGEGIWKEEEKEKPEPRHIMWEKNRFSIKGGITKTT